MPRRFEGKFPDLRQTAAWSDWIWITAFVALAAIAVTFGSRSTHDADSVLTAFMSTQKLTWYYWEQNRFANVIPWLASFSDDIEANFHLQLLLRNASALLSFALALVLLGERKHFALNFLASVVIWQLCASSLILFSVAIAQPISCALLLFGMLAARRRPGHPVVWALHSAAVLALFTAAFMVNISLVVFAVPFAFGSWVLGRSGHDLPFAQGRAVLLLFAAAALAYVHSALTPPATPTSLRFSWVAANSAVQTMLNTVNLTTLSLIAAGTFLVILLALLVCRKRFHLTFVPLPMAHVLAIVVIGASAMAFANLSWVQDNGNAERYYSVQTLVGLVLVSIWLINALVYALEDFDKYVMLGVGITGLAILVSRAGVPTPQRMFASNVAGHEFSINGDMDRMLIYIPRQRPLLVVGDYWFTPPLLYRRAARDDVRENYAITDHWAPLADTVSTLARSGDDFTLGCMKVTEAECLAKASSWTGQNIAGRTLSRLGTTALSGGGAFSAYGVSADPKD